MTMLWVVGKVQGEGRALHEDGLRVLDRVHQGDRWSSTDADWLQKGDGGLQPCWVAELRARRVSSGMEDSIWREVVCKSRQYCVRVKRGRGYQV